jgi:hypothetical protein
MGAQYCPKCAYASVIHAAFYVALPLATSSLQRLNDACLLEGTQWFKFFTENYVIINRVLSPILIPVSARVINSDLAWSYIDKLQQLHSHYPQQERCVERLGSNELIPIDMRVIAAQKNDLLALSVQKKFRRDAL